MSSYPTSPLDDLPSSSLSSSPSPLQPPIITSSIINNSSTTTTNHNNESSPRGGASTVGSDNSELCEQICIDQHLLQTYQYAEPAYINKILQEFKSGRKLKSSLEKKATTLKDHYFVLDDEETFIEVKDSKKKETKVHGM